MKVLIIGKGQVGTALASIISKHHDLTVYDVEAASKKDVGPYDVLHVCYPWHDKFVDTTVYYIYKFQPKLTLIESTVKPETTNKIHDITQQPICHSPVRGCHTSLLWGLHTYTKFIGPCTRKAGLLAERYYKSLRMKTYVATGSTETEVAKLANLSYYASQIAFFQELERKAKKHSLYYQDVTNFLESTTQDSKGEVQRPILKGDHIGGSCVMQGLQILFNPSSLWRWIEESNRKVE